MNEANVPWYKLLNRYHWFVFVVSALGWMFDCLDQQLFNLARAPAMKELLANTTLDVNAWGAYSTSVFLIGWAIGGLGFGILGDRIGRAKTMMLTILVYSIFTGFSAFSATVWDFFLWRFLTGLGVGGEFAVGVALVAEVMPERARPFALGLLQALSAVGNISAAIISMYLGHLEETGLVGSFMLFGVRLTAWRIMFLIGTLPALLCILIRRNLKEPERWQAATKEGAKGKSLGSFGELFGDPVWRKRAIVGVTLASSGVIGLWGIGFFSIDLNRQIFRRYYDNQARLAGDGDKDLQFVLLVLKDPQTSIDLIKAAKGSSQFKPADLIGGPVDWAGLPKEQLRDPERLYQAALELHAQQKAVDDASIINHLDYDAPEKNRSAQSHEDRTRREKLLAAGAGSAGLSLEDHVLRIGKRNNAIAGNLSWWSGVTSLTLNLGAFLGIYTFSRATHHLGRRLAFAIAFVSAGFATAAYFYLMNDSTIDLFGYVLFDKVFWLVPIMGFCQLSIFGGYAIYFPELFPTRLRSTGTSFCYNVGRLVAAIGPYFLGTLASTVFRNNPEPLRPAGLCMCGIFALGLMVLPFAPETKGQPLPE